MGRKLSVLVLMSVLIFLFSVPALCAINEAGIFFIKGSPLYSQNTKTFYGGEFQFFHGRRSFYLNISERLVVKQNPSGIGNFDADFFKAEIETSIWRFFVANFSLNLYRETEELCPFNQPRTIVLVDKWYKNEITVGIGAKIGRYDKSYISLTGILGNSFRGHTEDLKFLDTKLYYFDSSRIIGVSIKGRYGFKIVIPVRIDLRGDYYYLRDRKYVIEFATSLGIEVAKHLGIKGGAAVINIKDTSHFVARYFVGLVWIF